MLFSEISYKQQDAAEAMSIGWELVLTGHGDSGSQAPEAGSWELGAGSWELGPHYGGHGKRDGFGL